MIRFTDTQIWDEDWYCSLGGEYMKFWDYIKDHCDNAGVWRPNKGGFEIRTGFKINLDSFLSKVNGDKDRLIVLENGRWFIPGFIKFQWFNKSDSFDLVLTNKLHLSLFEILKKNSINPLTVRGLGEVLERSWDTPTQTSKDKEKGKGVSVKKKKKKGVVGEMIPFEKAAVFDKIQFKTAFPDWNKAKLAYYYDAAVRYSGEGNTYIDWKAAVASWARKDELIGKLKFPDDNAGSVRKSGFTTGT